MEYKIKKWTVQGQDFYRTLPEDRLMETWDYSSLKAALIEVSETMRPGDTITFEESQSMNPKFEDG